MLDQLNRYTDTATRINGTAKHRMGRQVATL